MNRQMKGVYRRTSIGIAITIRISTTGCICVSIPNVTNAGRLGATVEGAIVNGQI